MNRKGIHLLPLPVISKTYQIASIYLPFVVDYPFRILHNISNPFGGIGGNFGGNFGGNEML